MAKCLYWIFLAAHRLFIRVCPCSWVKTYTRYKPITSRQINGTVVTKDLVSVLSIFIHLCSVFSVHQFWWTAYFTTLESCWVYRCGDPLPCTLFTYAAIETGDTIISVQVQASGGSPHHHGNTWEKTGWDGGKLGGRSLQGDGDVLEWNVHLI